MRGDGRWSVVVGGNGWLSEVRVMGGDGDGCVAMGGDGWVVMGGDGW